MARLEGNVGCAERGGKTEGRRIWKETGEDGARGLQWGCADRGASPALFQFRHRGRKAASALLGLFLGRGFGGAFRRSRLGRRRSGSFSRWRLVQRQAWQPAAERSARRQQAVWLAEQQGAESCLPGPAREPHQRVSS